MPGFTKVNFWELLQQDWLQAGCALCHPTSSVETLQNNFNKKLNLRNKKLLAL